MSVFGPNQVGELIVGNAVASETTVPTFIATASAGEIKILSKDGTAPAAGKPFYVLQKTDGDASKNLNYEFSDVIDPKYIEKITVKQYAAEVAKVVKVDGFATSGVVAPQRTYVVEIRLEDMLSPENFTTISGYYITGEVLGSDDATSVRNGVLASLNANLARRGNGEFTAVVDGTGILITEKLQNNVPGKIDGRKLRFTVSGKVFNNVSLTGTHNNLGMLTATQTVAPSEGSGTGKWATNFEWFVKGYKYEAYRETGYPADFGDRTPFYTSKDATYNVIQIKYYEPRKETSVERQYKVLTILVVRTNLASNAVTNSVLTDLDTVAGDFVTIPSALATS
jgi:hypothetical protein